MNQCKQCGAPTVNPIFCSRSCATSYNNKKQPKRHKIQKLCSCGKPAKHRSIYCLNCTPHKDWSTVTYSDIIKLRKYQRHSRIRDLARTVFNNSNKPKKCLVCGYDKHIEVCHVKDIKTFKPEDKVSDINALTNLIALCPTHHWEFDNECLDKELII